MSQTATTPSPALDPSARPDFLPVADYGLLADCNSAALVSRDGSIGARGRPSTTSTRARTRSSSG